MGLGALTGLTPGSLFGLALAMMFLMGFTNPIVNGPLFALLQTVVAPEMQGRVFTLVIAAATAMTPLGLAIAGPVADAIGVQGWYLISGVVCAGLGLAGFFIPALATIEGQAGADAAAGSGAQALDDEVPARHLSVAAAEGSLDR